jgi:hypothetical protein
MLLYGCGKRDLGTPFNDTSFTVTDAVRKAFGAPCDSTLSINIIEGERNLDGFSRLNVHPRLNYFDNFEITCFHHSSTNVVYFEIAEHPQFIGERRYDLTGFNHHVSHRTNSFSSQESYSSESGSLYVEFKPDSIYISFCEIVMANRSKTNKLSGKVAVKRGQ